MPRNAFLLCAGMVVTGGVASAEETALARTFRYAILINQQEPIYGEVDIHANCSITKHPTLIVHSAAMTVLSSVRSSLVG